MKKLFFLALFPLLLLSCNTLKDMGLTLTTTDVANGLKQALDKGVDLAGNTLTTPSAFGGTALLNQIIPPNVANALNVARQLGLAPIIDKITNNLGAAATRTVQNSIPIFKTSISNMSISDAWGVLKGGNGAGTAYLRKTTGAAILNAIKPEVNSVFSSLGLKPNLLQNFGSGANNPLLGALNLSLTDAVASVVSDQMFATIEKEENNIRTNIAARTTPLLQKVFAAGAVLTQ